MPFKKGNSPYWKIRRKRLPGFGDSGTLSTRVKSKALARQMERLLDEIAERGLTDSRWHDVLRALRPTVRGMPGQITLPELLKAKHEGRLDHVVYVLRDPLLTDAVEDYLQTDQDYRTRNGLGLLLELAPTGARLTHLREAKHIMQLCAMAERRGMKRNTVRRGLHNGISKLLRFHLGKAARNEIFAEVVFTHEDDTRETYLSAGEIALLLEGCRLATLAEAYPHARQVQPLVRLALLTGADQAPLLRLRVKDVEIIAEHATGQMRGVVRIRDHKSDARPRSIAITHATCEELLPHLGGKAPGERVFTLTRHQLRHYFDKVRAETGLSQVRFKDLRHLFGIFSDKAGRSVAEIQVSMGHKRRETSLRYLQYQAVMNVEAAREIEREMGLAPSEPLRRANVQN